MEPRSGQNWPWREMVRVAELSWVDWLGIPLSQGLNADILARRPPLLLCSACFFKCVSQGRLLPGGPLQLQADGLSAPRSAEDTVFLSTEAAEAPRFASYWL